MDVWTLPDPLATRVIDAAGIIRPEDPTDVALRLSAWLLGGTSAKLGAMAAGAVPPGDDPEAGAQRVLAEPDASWSCWIFAGIAAGILTAAGTPSTVTTYRAVWSDLVIVDFHGVVTSATSDGLVVSDPYHGTGALALTGGVSSGDRLVTARLVAGYRPQMLTTMAQGIEIRYRIFGDVARDDVAALCRVSMMYSGLKRARTAKRTGATRSASVLEATDRTASGRVISRSGEGERVVEDSPFDSYADAVGWLRSLAIDAY